MEDVENSKFSIGTIAGLMVLCIPVFFFIAMNLPNWMAYLHHKPCWETMEEAYYIETAIGEYYSLHGHISVNQSEYEKLMEKPIGNPWTIIKKEDEYFIQVRDNTGRCHNRFQKRYPEWDSGVYTYQVNFD